MGLAFVLEAGIAAAQDAGVTPEPSVVETPSTPAFRPQPVIVNVPAPAETKPLTGLWLTTDFPALTERLGDGIGLPLRLENKNLPPQRVELAVDGLPESWAYELEGAGRPVTAAFVVHDETAQLTLKVMPPQDAAPGSYSFRVTGTAGNGTLTLPIVLNLAEAKAAKVTLEPKLPALRGTPRSNFDFPVTIRNDGAEEQLFTLIAGSEGGLETTFSAESGTQELTSIPVKAGETKDLKVSVKLPQNAAAGQYPVLIEAASAESSAEAELVLDVTGLPSLSLVGPEGRLSGDATAGQERSFTLSLKNTGTAPAKDVRLTATAPAGWKVAFDQAEIATVAPAAELEVVAAITPAEQAIAGDYIVSLRAAGQSVSAGADLRVTVLTSTLWGVAGLGVIGAAVIVLAVAVTRYGRR